MKGNAYVSDASAMLALLKQEPGWKAFRAILQKPDTLCYAHSTALAEVFSDVRRTHGEDTAQEALIRLADAGIRFREDFGPHFWQDAARIKSNYPHVSLANCFGLALARRLGCSFLSIDHDELNTIHADEVCPVKFVR